MNSFVQTIISRKEFFDFCTGALSSKMIVALDLRLWDSVLADWSLSKSKWFVEPLVLTMGSMGNKH